MKLIVLGRQEGKTWALLDWVRQAKRVKAYPFWSRVIVTPDMAQADRLRHQLSRSHAQPDGLEYNMVYFYGEWINASLGIRWDGEIGLDNADMLLQMIFNGRGLITMATFTKEEE